MFENVLGQPAADQLMQDIKAGVLAPAMLFSGPAASGKGTAALELGRVVSCESRSATPGMPATVGEAPWNCSCSACTRHRLLIHQDLLCLGSRPFSAEIAASAGAFLRENSSPARTLFIRSMRKLLARFNPVLWEDEPKIKKVSPLVLSLEEELDDSDSLGPELVKGLVKNAFQLESEGMVETIPIDQIRRAAVWSRLAPAGRGKLLLIENADRMQEKARNSLLKLLEEPPGRTTIVLTTQRPGSLIPTILSRLRPYRFTSRGAAVEAEVIRRVFRDKVINVGINAYLETFLPVTKDTLNALAAFFAASAAYKAALLSGRPGQGQGRSLSNEVVLLGKYTAPRAEAAGFGRPRGEAGAVIPLVLEKAEKFVIRSLFSRFLCCLLELVSSSLKTANPPCLTTVAYNEMWIRCTAWAENAAGTYNLTITQVLEKLFTDLSRGMAEL